MTKFPICRKCPNCHGSDFKRLKPKRPIAFTDDRECKSCGTRYTPPTPLWAAVLFLVIGVCILLVDMFAIWVGFVRGGTFWLALRVYVFLLMTLSTGVGCIVFGLRSIRSQDDVPSPNDGGELPV
jgi:hypothetical protein